MVQFQNAIINPKSIQYVQVERTPGYTASLHYDVTVKTRSGLLQFTCCAPRELKQLADHLAVGIDQLAEIVRFADK